MIIKLFLSNNAVVDIKTKHVTIEGFAEDLASISSGTFTLQGKHMYRIGDFIDFYTGKHIKYESIIAFEEVSEADNE